MPETHNDSFQINISLQALPPKQLGFGTGLLLAEKVNNGSGQTVKSYEDAESVEADWSSTEGDAAEAYFAQDPEPDRLLVGEWDKGTGETIDVALNNIIAADDDFFAVMTTSRVDSEVENLSNEVETNSKPMICFIQLSDDELVTGSTLPAGLGSDFDTRERTFGCYHTTDSEYLDMAWAARVLAYDQDDNSPPFFADIAGVADYTSLPDGATIGSQQSPGNARANNFNVMLDLGGTPWLAPGTNAAGRQGKVIVTRDWFEDRLQGKVTNVIKTLRADGEGLPVGESGTSKTVGQIEMAKQIRAQYNQGAEVGHFLNGQLNLEYPTVTSGDVSSGIIPMEGSMTVVINGQAVTFDLNFSRDPVNT